ncbi:hypothetical protein AB6E20_12530 [Vibrio cyclitrophicus]
MKSELALEFYQELYRLELDKKEKITQQAQLRFAVLLTVSSLLLYMIKTVELNSDFYFLLTFSLSMIFSLLGMLWSANSAYKIFWGNEYTYLANAAQYEEQRQSLIAAYGETMPEKVNYLWKSLIIDSIVQASDANHQINLNRQESMIRFTRQFHVALVAFVISGSIFLGCDLDSSSPRKVLSVEVVNKL